MHGRDYWNKNLYTLWLSALRAASPGGETEQPVAHGLPAYFGTEAWQRRILNTQLASWAELRHDTMLYAKQSYTSGAACAFPDGYVDPYPAVYERLRQYALKGQEVVALLAPHTAALTRIQRDFQELGVVTTMLRDMAEHQRSGQPFDDAQMAFLNEAVKGSGCTAEDQQYTRGWYVRLTNATAHRWTPASRTCTPIRAARTARRKCCTWAWACRG